jgi:hypothetical protein
MPEPTAVQNTNQNTATSTTRFTPISFAGDMAGSHAILANQTEIKVADRTLVSQISISPEVVRWQTPWPMCYPLRHGVFNRLIAGMTADQGDNRRSNDKGGMSIRVAVDYSGQDALPGIAFEASTTTAKIWINVAKLARPQRTWC